MSIHIVKTKVKPTVLAPYTDVTTVGDSCNLDNAIHLSIIFALCFGRQTVFYILNKSEKRPELSSIFLLNP